MILTLVVALFAFGECTGGDAVSGVYSDYRDVIDIGGYGVKQYDPKSYLEAMKGDDKDKVVYFYSDGDKQGRENDKNDGRVYLDGYKGYDNEQKYKDIKDGEEQKFDDKKDGYIDGQKYESPKEGYYYEQKYDGQKKGYDNEQEYKDKKDGYNGEQKYDDKKDGYKDEQKYEGQKEGYYYEQKFEGQKEGYNYEQKYDEQKKEYDDKQKNKDGKDRYDDKKYNNENLKIFYGESKFEKYDGPKDYLVADKKDRYRNDRKYYYRRKGDDIKEYDYVAKCDVNEKNCNDGKDCYDKAKDRTSYDRCRGTYGNEDRYYDEKDRYDGDRYRFDDDREGYEYERECYDNTKDRADYDKCRKYYKKCSEYKRSDYKQSDYKQGDYKRSDYEYSYYEDDWKNDKDCYYEGNLVGLGRRDREDQLIRPCALDDRQCIRKYFAKNSKCKPAYGPIPDPLYLKRNTIYMPFANVTMIKTRLRVTGLSSIKIIEFYINKDTKNLVIAFDFNKLNQTSPRNYFRYKRTAKESIVLSDYTSLEYNSGTFTAVIPKIPYLRLDLAEVHADIDDLIPRFFFGPGVANSTDPDVITGFARLGSNFPVFTQELFLLQAQLFTAIYIQENICDFGLKLISV